MAVYFDHRIEAPDNSADPSHLTWHSTLPILAVASSSPASGGCVDLYLQQGEYVESCHVERPHQAAVLRWHPLKPVLALGWENGENLLAVNNSRTVLILCEHVMSAHFSQQVAAVQLTPTQLSVTHFTTGTTLPLQCDMHIKGVCVSKGTVKQLLTFSKAEGNPVLLNVCQSYLVVGTDTAHIRVYDLSRRDAKAHCSAKNLADHITMLGALRSVKCNANGSQVSILISQEDVSVVTLFCTQEHGLLLQDCFSKPSGLQALLALNVPYYYFSCKPGEGHPGTTEASLPSDQSESTSGAPAASPQMVSRRPLRDFVGLEKCEKGTRDAMLNFSFYLTVGDMDEAFKAIKLIKR
ncbi:hypothetical protein GOODEAATRI_006474 [Goodea atripinnis]|uniref:WD repeat domain phosphoinositide-interacting protein 2 n=1 Tax=Goodea atripinnis TaxID=208336 RepID=A0ABV0MIE7_9TELE